ncbi:phage tail tape measure protein, partial [Parafannyhessea umbonata]|uniref:phage tail tape measure protein n=1 Tax=Parafannyhessea umbonata TaxID=604330 RepID=UPI003F97BFFF
MSRTVMARLTIDGVQGVITGFRQVGQAAVEYSRTAQKAGTTATRWMDKHSDQLGRLGGTLLKVGAVGALALGGLAKSAIDWESAWAGVTKTVDGTPQQMAAIEAGLRSMAKELPSSHREIAAVAEAAGQLGVKSEAIVGFTRTMIDLGETTNLSADEAATSLAQLMNVMGTSQADVRRLGSAVVALGNNGATTERDIVSLSQRLAAAGSQMGMTEADVLATAAAMASVGVEAEAGGTAMSKTWRLIDAHVRAGGNGLATLARISGQTADEFREKWGRDAAGATADFVEGLGRMRASGEDVNAVLKDLGVDGERQLDVIGRLAGATRAAGTEQDLLRDALKLGAEAWEQNNALSLEAAKRYETRAAQAQIAINSIRDEAITLGQTLLPVVDSVLRGLSALAEAFGSLPSAAKTGVVGIGLLTTAGLLAAGGVLKAVKALHDFKIALAGLGISVRTATLAMGAIRLALTAAGLLLGAWMGRQAEATQRAREYTDAIRQQGTVIGEASRALAAQHLQDSGLFDLAQKAQVGLADLTDAALGNADAMARVRSQLDASKSALEGQVRANDAAIESMRAKGVATEDEQIKLAGLVRENDRLKSTLSDRVSLSDEVTSRLAEESQLVGDAAAKAAQMAEATEGSTDAAKDNEKALQKQADAAQRSAEAQKELLEATQAYGNELLKMSGSQIAVEKSIASLAEQVKKGEKGLDLATEAGRANQEALNDLAQASISYIGTLYDQGASADQITAATKRARDEWVRGAVAMGKSKDEADKLAAAYFAIPDDVRTQIAATGAPQATQIADRWKGLLASIPEEERTRFLATLHGKSAAEVESAFQQLARDRAAQIKVRYTMTNNIPEMRTSSGLVATGRAMGGPIYGPGTATSDSIPIMASTGEYVIRAASAARLGRGVLDYINAHGAVPRFRDGGSVTAYRPTLSAPTLRHSVDTSGISAAVADGLAGVRIVMVDPTSGVERLVDARIEMAGRRSASTVR